MNLQEELKALKERIVELEEQAKREQEFPQYGDTYWCINAYGGVSKEIWDGYDIEKDMLEIGNGFITEQGAELAVEKLKVEAELRNFSRPFTNNDDNYYIELYPSDKTLAIGISEYFQTQGTIYFESTKIVNEAIDTVGADRIKKYIFGVED